MSASHEVLVITRHPWVARWAAEHLGEDYPVRSAPGINEALFALGRYRPRAVIVEDASARGGAEELLELLASFYPDVRRLLFVSAPIQRYRDLLVRGLVDAVLDRDPRTREDLLAAIEQ